MSRPTVPGYEVEAILGEGASSVVWRARRLADQVLVALKVTREPLRRPDPWLSGWSVGPQDAEAVVAELQWLRTLRHPGVVTLLDALVLDDRRLVLVLDLAEGGSLADLVTSRGHLTQEEVTTVLLGLAATLSDLHDLDLVHGDLAPGNVLLDADGRPLVADLGTVSVLGDLVDDPWGTTGFVAPERSVGEDPSGACDVYSLGALGWFALLGEARQTATDPLELAARCPEVDPALVELIGACLAPSPRDRPALTEVSRRLEELGEPVTVDVAATPRPPDVTRRVREQALEQQRAQTRARERAAKLEAARRDLRRPALVRHRTLVVAAVVGLVAGIGGGKVWLDRAGTATELVSATSPATAGSPAPPAPSASTGPSPARASAAGGRGGAAVGSPTASPSPAAAAQPAASRAEAVTVAPREVVQELLDHRSQALMARNAARLGAADLPGSWAMRQDGATIAELARRGQRQQGLSFQVRSASVVRASATESTIRADVRLADYSWTDGTGPARVQPGHDGRTSDYVLRWTPAGWRLDTVRDVPQGR
ncbi:serine/threonine-protein kinase [Arsenicicoccus sp. oral taxon 190]|uniref:serine/threonine-protein kinase n=1 Tax=Arsenicicoccus sp. oral taxon 190 TaxID=1658671 RepID=UPI00067A10D3|nr:serine/threonine-protein kinase [Arsenicicoccus sp. oral taxon 190]AKT52102.1 hypothetical protein ADJ73_13910 [Arsenicicoccus sp. oral taxon 190]